MPAFIKTAENEKLWARAKDAVKKEYNLFEKDEEKFWRLVTGIYKKMGGHTGSTNEEHLGDIISLQYKKRTGK